MSADEEPFITTEEAAKLLKVSHHTLERWRLKRHDGPPYYEFANNAKRYKRSSLLAWAETQRVEHGVKIGPRMPGDPPRPWEQRT